MVFHSSITERKMNGQSLSQSDIEFIVNGYTSGMINDSEMTSFLKAVFQQGMNHQETLDYTQTMLNSGVRLDFSDFPGYVVDKHSTGGVGDKVSLVLGPLLAACNCYIPMLAGRGLEHTGGTIDKLESIPGYQTELPLSKFQNIVKDVGISIMSPTKEICPADRKIYALRDLTGTVASFPLICGSIMSKKISAGLQGLVMDIKVGNGAFMKTIEDADALGSLLKGVGKLYGLGVSICLTRMDQPLGRTAGLWCEVMESMECLNGNGPKDVLSVVYHLGEKALKMVGTPNPKERLKTALSNGSALNKFKEMVVAHGGDSASLDNAETFKPLYRKKIMAEHNGFITAMDTRKLGLGVVHLGGGKYNREDILDPTAGMLFMKKIGDSVNIGEPLIEIFCSSKEKVDSCKLYLNDTIRIKPTLSEPKNVIIK